MGFEVRHDFGEYREDQDVNVHEGLEHPIVLVIMDLRWDNLVEAVKFSIR